LAPVKIQSCWPRPKFGQVGSSSNLVVFGRVDRDRNLIVFRRVGPDLNLVEFSQVGHDQNLVESALTQICIQLSRSWIKTGHIQSSRSWPTNLVESILTEIWLIRPWPKCGHIWPSRLWPKFGRIKKNLSWPKFDRIQSCRCRLKFCRVGLGPNLVTSSPTEIRSNLAESTLVKFGWVDLGKIWPNSTKSSSTKIRLVPTESLSSSSHAEIWSHWPRQKICQILWCQPYGHKF